MTAALLERERSVAPSNRRPAAGSRRAPGPATAKPAVRPKPATKPKLKVLDQRAIRQRARRRHGLFVLFIVVLLGFFAVAFVHAELVAGQQDLDAIRSRIAEAEAENAKLARAAEIASSPQAIVARATELGMVRAYEPVYLSAVAPIPDLPSIVPLPSASKRSSFSDVTSGPNNGSSIAIGISASAAVVRTGAVDRPAVAMPSPLGGGGAGDLGADSLSGSTVSAAGIDVSSVRTTSADPGGGGVTSIAGTRAVTGGSGNG